MALVLGLALDPAFVASTVESLGEMIEQEYFDPAVGAAVHAALRRSLAEGRYAGADSDAALAQLVNRDLLTATRDAPAMRFLRGDAPIVDLRANGGGSPGTVAPIISYLLDAPALPLFDILHRAPLPPDH